jgi:hypothetical protein
MVTVVVARPGFLTKCGRREPGGLVESLSLDCTDRDEPGFS